MKAPRAKKTVVRTEQVAEDRAALIPAHYLFLFTSIVSFLVYLRTLAKGIHFGDGLELATAAHILGVPHPTGYPLYMLLLKLFTWLPIGEVIARTTLFSAVCMALAVGTTSLILRSFITRVVPAWTEKAVVITAAAGALGAALLKFHWNNATVTEVYAFQFLLMVLFTWCGLQFLQSLQSKWLVVAAACIGAGLANHRLTLLLGIPMVLLLLHAWKFKGRGPAAKIIAVSAMVICIFLSVYVYLPIRAKAKPAINWGNPDTAGRFIKHVRGGDYLDSFFLRINPGKPLTASTYGMFASHRAATLVADFVDQLTPAPYTSKPVQELSRVFRRPEALTSLLFIILSGATVAGIFAGVRAWTAGFGIIALIAAQNLAPIFLYTIQDIADYYLYLFWFGWLSLYIGLVWLVSRAAEGGGFLSRPELAYVFVLLPLLIGLGNWRRCDRSADFSAADYSSMILPADKTKMPEGSILLTSGDNDIYTAWYRQLVKSERRDVLVYGSNFVHRDWYASFFTPEQISRYRLKFGGSIPYDPVEFVARLSNSVIDANIGTTPVFTSSTDPHMLRALSAKYDVQELERQAFEEFDPYSPLAVASLYRIHPKGKGPKQQ